MNKMIEDNNNYLMHTYNSIPVSFTSGEGCYLTDTEGKKYLDMLSGIAVSSLGYNHPDFNRAVKKQLENVIHYSNLFMNMPQNELARKLVSNSTFSKAFFCNSGTEAVEAALKLAKKYGKVKKNGAWKIIAMNQSFHGRSTGSLSLTGQIKYRESFIPLLPGIMFAKFNDFADLKSKADSETCAVIMEPVQGEGGIYPAEKGYLEKVRNFCTENGIALIFDEVQCGMGRTGSLFAHERYGVYPDIVCLAKGLGGGLPIGAILSTGEFDLFEPGDHAATFGGNPLVCAGASVVVDQLTKNNLLDQVTRVSSYFFNSLEAMKRRNSIITDVRGLGLMIGVELKTSAAETAGKCREKGLIVGTAGTNVLRLVPPLIITEKEVDKAAGILEEVFKTSPIET